jgi:hypothetical protein
MTHTTTLRALRGGLAAAAALLAVCAAAPAHAAPEPAGDWLLVTVTPSGAAAPGGTLLRCDPPRGHARADRACAELQAADGDIGRIPPREAVCPMVYAPVTAHAHGRWRGRSVEYTGTFSNSCVMESRTGAVFALGTGGT